MPTVNKVHYDKYLTEISIGYQNEAFIADQIFLSVPVDKQSDKYYVFGMEKFKVHSDYRAPGTESNEINWSFSDDSYYTDGHALSTFVTDEETPNADEVIRQELEANATELTTEAILLNKEIDAANKLTDTSLVDSDMFETVTHKWSNYADADSNPQLDIEEAKEKMHKKSGLRPNTLIVSEPVFNKLKFHPKLLALLGNNSLQMLTQSMIETMLGVRIVIGSALKDATAANSPNIPALNYVWGLTAVLCYIAPKAVGRKTRTCALSFYWTAKGSNGVGVRKWYEVAKQATKVEAEHWYDHKIISKNSSYIFVDAIVAA